MTPELRQALQDIWRSPAWRSGDKPPDLIEEDMTACQAPGAWSALATLLGTPTTEDPVVLTRVVLRARLLLALSEAEQVKPKAEDWDGMTVVLAYIARTILHVHGDPS